MVKQLKEKIFILSYFINGLLKKVAPTLWTTNQGRAGEEKESLKKNTPKCLFNELSVTYMISKYWIEFSPIVFAS